MYIYIYIHVYILYVICIYIYTYVDGYCFSIIIPIVFHSPTRTMLLVSGPFSSLEPGGVSGLRDWPQLDLYSNGYGNMSWDN